MRLAPNRLCWLNGRGLMASTTDVRLRSEVEMSDIAIAALLAGNDAARLDDLGRDRDLGRADRARSAASSSATRSRSTSRPGSASSARSPASCSRSSPAPRSTCRSSGASGRRRSSIGLVSFFAPFIVVGLLCYYGLGWNHRQAEIGGLALSTTSLAVVYAVLVETGLNRELIGKRIMSATFVTDIATVAGLTILFITPTIWIVPFVLVSIARDRRAARSSRRGSSAATATA